MGRFTDRRTRIAMSSEGPISRWVAALKGGDAAAAQPLWERYHRRLVTLARQKLSPARRRAADEEDVVQNAFHSFFRGVSAGRFPQLNDRDNLWRLLVVITARKALDQLAHDHRKRRGGGTVQGESGIFPGAGRWDDAAIEQIVGDEPTPPITDPGPRGDLASRPTPHISGRIYPDWRIVEAPTRICPLTARQRDCRSRAA